jgi:cell division protein FtsQ
MTAKSIIVKIFTWILAAGVGGGMLTLLIAANRKQKAEVCRDIVITIKGAGEQLFIDKNDILQTVNTVAHGSVISKPVGKIKLASLERALEKNAWIADAETYFDSRDVLHIIVNEREPVARIFTTNGQTFYIDSNGKQMPVLFKETARVLVVTNFTGARKYNAADSLMAADVKAIANAIFRDPFWKEQIGQVDITPKGNYDAIPVIGNHIIRLGKAENIVTKLSNLFLFYKQVLAKTGFDKYATVDVQYNGQVIGIHHGASSAIDSLQLQKNIEELLSGSNRSAESDSEGFVLSIRTDSGYRASPKPVDTLRSNAPKNPSLPVNATNDSANRSHAANQRPRAVMPNRKNE